MLNLNSTIDLDWQDFLHWWKSELLSILPEKIKNLIFDVQGFLIVKVTPQQLILNYQVADQTEFLGVLARDQSAIAEYQELFANDERLKTAKVILRLTKDYALQRELALPIATKENLVQVINYELDRYTPFKVEQVYFAIKKLPKQLQVSAAQIKVILIMTNKTIFNDIYNEVKALGITPEVADYEDVDNNFYYERESYNLLPAWLSSNKKMPYLHKALLIMVPVLLLTSLILPVWFQYQTVEMLTTKARRLEKQVKEIEGLQAELRTLQEETQQLLDQKNALPPMYVILNTLSQLTPDDTWLSYLQYVNGQLQIQGESPSASALIERLEKSDIFEHASFVSPVTQDSVSKRERFQISLELTKPQTQNTNANK